MKRIFYQFELNRQDDQQQDIQTWFQQFDAVSIFKPTQLFQTSFVLKDYSVVG